MNESNQTRKILLRLIPLLILVGAIVMITVVFWVREVKVTGNTRHTSDEISAVLLSGTLEKNTLYLMWKFQKGDILGFNLLLFGRTIVYFTQFLQAFHYLGMQGLGKNHVPFRVKQVTNSKGEILVDGNNVFKENYKVMCLEEYVRYRLSRLPKDKHYTLIFHSPLTIKYRGEVQNSFSPEAVLAAVERRLYILNCFEGREEGVDYERINVMDHVPTLTDQKVYSENIRRFSGTQKAKMSFYGIRGYCSLTGMDDLTKAILAAGELVHIGKNTSFGFGRYTLTEI